MSDAGKSFVSKSNSWRDNPISKLLPVAVCWFLLTDGLTIHFLITSSDGIWSSVGFIIKSLTPVVIPVTGSTRSRGGGATSKKGLLLISHSKVEVKQYHSLPTFVFCILFLLIFILLIYSFILLFYLIFLLLIIPLIEWFILSQTQRILLLVRNVKEGDNFIMMIWWPIMLVLLYAIGWDCEAQSYAANQYKFQIQNERFKKANLLIRHFWSTCNPDVSSAMQT